MKAYPSIGRGLRIVFFSEILVLLITCYSVISFFFGLTKLILPFVLVLDILVCCGLTAGAAFCWKEDKKYLPAIALGAASIVLAVSALFLPYGVVSAFLWVLQAAAAWLFVYTLCNRTSQLLEDRDRSCARYGGIVSLLYLIPCVIRYYTFSRFVDATPTSYQYIPFDAKMAGTAVCLAVVLVLSGMLLRFFNSAGALLQYQTEHNR